MRHLSTLLILLSINISLMAQSVGVNLPDGTTANTMLDVNGSVSFREGTALTCANGVNSNIALANYSFYRVTGPTAAFSITGFANGTDGRCLTIINASGQTMTLSHLTTSTTANQINTGGSAVVLPANGVATLMYNANLTKWIVSGTMGSSPSFAAINNGSFSDSMIVINGGVPFKVRPVDYIETYAWGLDGNAGTIDGTNFLGTTDNIPLSIRVNNQKAGRIDHLLNNAFWGYQAGNAITSGTNNVAIGSTALSTMTTGNENVAIGGQSAFSNTTGVRNVSIGYQSARNGTHSNSVMIGYQAGLQNAASNNVFIGSLSGPATSTGSDNIGMGYYTLFNNQTGKNNVAIGTFALSTTTAAWGNTAVGYLSSASIQTGQANTALGDSSLMNNVLGSSNTHLGYRAGLWTTGSNNIAIGANAALPVSTANNQLALGTWLYGTNSNLGINTIAPQYKLDIDANTGSTGNPLRLQGLQAGLTSDSIVSSSGGILRRLSIAQVVGSGAWSTTGNASTVDGTNFLGTTDAVALNFRVNNQKAGRISHSSDNTFFGYQTGNVATGTGNTFIGYQAGDVNTSGESNTVVGANAFGANTGGKDNVAIGFEAMKANTSGDDNTAIGKLAMTSNTSGQHNVAVGEAAMQLNTTGEQNTALGREALYANTIGRDNTALGYNALRANTTGDRSIAIGKNALITQSFNNGGSAYNTQNVAIGYEALSVNQPTSSSNGINNTAVGYQSGKANTIGTNNTFIGNYAGEVNTTGSNNATLGYQAGSNITTGSNNIAIGYQATVPTATVSNQLSIGNWIYGVSGNIGIGLTAPSVKLHIDGGNATATYQKFTAGTTTGQTATDGFDVGIDATGNAYLDQNENLPMIFNTNNTERMRITADGKVGIGTTNPTDRLEIVSESADDNFDDGSIITYAASATPSFSLKRAKGTAAAPTTVGNSEYSGGFNTFVHNGTSFVNATGINVITASDFTTSGGSELNFSTGRSGTITDRMRITSTGNVGIGIPAPSHILHINGQGRATNSAWATTSDSRLKNIDGRYEYGLKELLKINTYRFHYKTDNPLKLPTDKDFQGVIAQELQKVIPEAVQNNPDGYLTVNNDPVFWTMLNAIKELDAKVQALTKENVALKTKVSELDALKAEVEKIKKAIGIEPSTKN